MSAASYGRMKAVDNDSSLIPGRTPMKFESFLALICLAVLCITLSLGLWPFHSPRSDASWPPNQNALEFGKYSSAFSLRSLPPTTAPEATIEIWLLPRRIWDSGTALSFYNAETRSQFSIRQSLTDLALEAETQNPHINHRFCVDDLFRPRRPVFLTVTAGQQGVSVYLDGAPAKTVPHFPLAANAFTGRLIVADSAWQTDNWRGQIFALAIYHRALTPQEVRQNYTDWKQKGRPEIAADRRNVALYLFDEHTGSIVHDKSPSAIDLYIPPRYQVIDKIALEPVWSEFSLTRSYWSAALKNIVGFMPFGFCYYAFLSTVLKLKRAKLITILLGTAVSLTIEVLQAFLPTRDSGTTDILTNTLGTWVGVWSYTLFIPILTRFFPSLPLPKYQ